MLKYYSALLLILLFSTSAIAQFSENSTHRFGYKIISTGSYSSGNAPKVTSINSVELSFLSNNKKLALKSLTTYTYNNVNYRALENNALNRNIFFYKTSKKIYPIGLLWVENSLIRKFNFLIQTGAGMAYVPIENKKNHLNLAGFISYESKHFNGIIFNNKRYNGLETIETTRFNLRVHGIHSIGTFPIQLNYEAYYQPSLAYFHNYRLHGESAISLAISKKFSVRMGVTYNKESVVLSTVKPQDITMTWGLSFSNF